MQMMFHVTTENAAPLVAPLAAACARAGISWGCFFTNDGVKVLADTAFVGVLAGADKAVVCEHSWHQFMGAAACPVELGSQTINSAMMAEAEKVVSL